MKKHFNGKDIEMTAEEISARETDVAQHEAKAIQEATAQTEKLNAQISGNTKLLDLGLTQAEATAMTGYAPPVEE